VSDRDTIVSDIQIELGWLDIKATEIENALKRAQEKYETGSLPELPWFLISEIVTSETTADEERLAVPSDFLREHDDGTLWRFDSSADEEDQWINLPKSDYDELVKTYGSSTDKPLYYALIGDYFRLKPTPDAVYPIKMLYYAKDTVLNSNIENDWLKYAPEVLQGEAGRRMALAFRDKGAMEYFEDMRNEGILALTNATEARKHENQNYIMGGED